MSNFRRIAFVDEPAISGAQWWQDSVVGATSRRGCAIGLVALVALPVVGMGACLSLAMLGGSGSGSTPEGGESVDNRPALDMQRRYGWSFGANGEPLRLLPFERASANEPADFANLSRPHQLAPREAAYQPFFSAVLFEVVTAVPLEKPPADTAPFLSFKDAYRSIKPAPLLQPYKVGLAIARLFDKDGSKPTLIVDLPGPESIALAAGAASLFAPVYMLQNWPHPQGVVKSHLTIAAFALFDQALGTLHGTRPVGAPPMFVLDNTRLTNLVDVVEDFDNRYAVTLPSAADLKRTGATEVFLVASLLGQSLDLIGRLREYEAAGIKVRRLDPTEFSSAPADTPLDKTPPGYAEWATDPVAFAGAGLPAFRTAYRGAKGTPFGVGHAWRVPAAPAAPAPSTLPIGLVPVVIAGGIIVGADAARRRGTWSRTLYGGGG